MNELEIIQHQEIEGFSLFLNTVDYRTAHLHPEWELIWVLENTLAVSCGEYQYLIEPGQMILFNPHETHEFRKTDAGCTFACLQISDKILPINSRLYADANCPQAFLTESEMESIQNMFREMLRAYLLQKPQYALFCIGQCCMIFHLLLSRIPHHELTPEQASGMDKRNALLKRILQFVDENYMHKIKLSDFAEAEGYSMSYISRFIKNAMNQTFQEYVTSVRVSHACDCIAIGEKGMLEICVESGFSDYRYFSKAFQKLYGMTPVAYSRNKKDEMRTLVTCHSPRSEERFFSKEESLMILETLNL